MGAYGLDIILSKDMLYYLVNPRTFLMGEDASTTAPDFQTMLRKVQETDYHTSEEEQREIENMGRDLNFYLRQTFMNQVNAEIDSMQEQLTRRATNGEISEAEATRQFRTFCADRYERAMRELMALYDSR